MSEHVVYAVVCVCVCVCVCASAWQDSNALHVLMALPCLTVSCFDREAAECFVLSKCSEYVAGVHMLYTACATAHLSRECVLCVVCCECVCV